MELAEMRAQLLCDIYNKIQQKSCDAIRSLFATWDNGLQLNVIYALIYRCFKYDRLALGVINILHTADNPLWTHYIVSVFISIIDEESMNG